MIALPHMPLFVIDLETDETCKLMDDAHYGSYVRCLVRQWIEGSLPGDLGTVARLVGSPAKRVGTFLDAKFPIGADGRRRNTKLDDLRADRLAKADKNRESANKRWGSGRTSEGTCERISEMDAIGDAKGVPRASDSVSGSGSCSVPGVGVQGKGAAPPDPLNTPEFIAAWSAWTGYRHEAKHRTLKPASVAAQWRRLARMGHDRAIAAIEHSIANAYQGVFEDKDTSHANRNGTARTPDHAAARRTARAATEYDEPDLKPPVYRAGQGAA